MGSLGYRGFRAACLPKPGGTSATRASSPRASLRLAVFGLELEKVRRLEETSNQEGLGFRVWDLGFGV